ncbi:MAG: hypothetical protein QOI54_3579 [Actinomycetota bacterium]|jgi:ATP-dependent Clp protease ATP-binding subunit ClpA|nr:hypothetical protein [Actinomycetota bacterium]
MFNRFSRSARAAVQAAVEEAERRGDARVGTEHLLLGILHEAGSSAARVLGVDVVTARAELQAMDVDALASVGIDLGPGNDAFLAPRPSRAGGHRPFTSAAKAALVRTLVEAQRRGDRRLEPLHLLLALLDADPREPVARLLARFDVDPAAVRAQLSAAA